MRKSIYMILAAALLTAACENDVDIIWSDSNKAILVLNAQLQQDDASHRIFINCSEGSRSEKVTDADVTCSINGGTAIKVLPATVEYDLFDGSTASEHTGYGFDTSLKAGDRLDIQVRWKGLSASASFTVPESSAKITAVDTARVELAEEGNYGGNTHTTRQYLITVKDKPDEKNYYMLRFQDVYYKLDESGAKVDSLVCRGSFDASDDKILHPVQNSIIDELFGNYNDYDIFNDEMFSGSTCTLKVYDSYYALYFDDWMNFWNKFLEGERYSLDRRIKVYTITFDEYLYLNAIGSAANDLEFMTEPVIYPENVTGGLGFVSVATPAVWAISFPPQEYDGEAPINAYRYVDPMYYPEDWPTE